MNIGDFSPMYNSTFTDNGVSGYGNAFSTGAGQNVQTTGAEKPGAVPFNDSVGKIEQPKECQTCKNRKYQDGSNEMVSFKSASHISPEAAPATVRAHEGEHVANAYNKAAQSGGKVLQASVSLKTAICPECGRAYVCGGVTNTRISYPAENNPYSSNIKSMQSEALKGNSIDLKIS